VGRYVDWIGESDHQVAVPSSRQKASERAAHGGILQHVLMMTELLGRPLVKTVAWATWFLEQYGDAFPE
jgi:hypothetical protein